MNNSIITFEQIQSLREYEIENIEHNGMVILFNEYNVFEVYSKSQSEESDSNPIYTTASITELYNYLNQ